MKHELIQTENYLLIVDDSKKTIAHLPLKSSPVLEGVDLLPLIEDDGCKDLFYSKQVMNPYSKESQSYTAYEKGFIDGYNKAKEKYKYTEEDLRKAIILSATSNIDFLPDRADKVLQSIQQPKMPVGFECEMEMCENNDVVFEDGSFNKPPYRLEKKKIKNLQGQTLWVGKYIFND
jgi:hypothetical protein